MTQELTGRPVRAQPRPAELVWLTPNERFMVSGTLAQVRAALQRARAQYIVTRVSDPTPAGDGTFYATVSVLRQQREAPPAPKKIGWRGGVLITLGIFFLLAAIGWVVLHIIGYIIAGLITVAVIALVVLLFGRSGGGSGGSRGGRGGGSINVSQSVNIRL